MPESTASFRDRRPALVRGPSEPGVARAVLALDSKMPHFYLRIAPADAVKVIISVSKKVSKKAVVRNRIRRRVRPILALLKADLKPAEYFIIANPGAENLKGEGLKSELIRLIRSIRN